MRLQETWIPDIHPEMNKSKVVETASQENLKNVILSCLEVGMNHFETARFYGSSEVQFVNALAELMEESVIDRKDFILQTKLFPGERENFEGQWEDTWSNVKRLGHVDLLTFHCVTSPDQVEMVLCDAQEGIYNFVLNLQEEHKINHIGFSTHGSSEIIMQLINSQKFAYVNLHKHFFGDYHAEGTTDKLGGHGNSACVKRALELDMGVLNISPFDKGGKLYRPSSALAAAIGPELSPIAFAALYSWKTQGMHTISVGLARSSDLDEVIEAARIYADGEKAESVVKAAESRLEELAIDKLGKNWYEQGLSNLPSFFDKESDGMGIGHMLWLHGCVKAYGMYDFAKDRYASLEKTIWDPSKSFDENVKNL